jgi:hypothetical protein
MALLKAKELPNGATATFWIIEVTDIKWKAKSLRLVVEGYKDRATYETDGSTPLSTPETRLWTGADFPLDKTKPNTMEQVYNKLKESDFRVHELDTEPDSVPIEHNFFADAEDDIL